MPLDHDRENGLMAVSVTEPLYLSEHFMRDGHSAEKANGTMTYIRFEGHLFGVTCAHVYFQQYDESGIAGKCLTAFGDRVVYQFGTWVESGYKSHFRSMRNSSGDTSNPDIAIVFLDEAYESIHMSRKSKSAINLSAMEEPNWKSANMCMAAGFPTEHKTQTEQIVSAELLQVIAECTTPISPGREKFSLFSCLSEPHNVYLSGMSGGPIFCDSVNEEELALVGIIFEGTPGSSEQWRARGESSFYTGNDVHISGYTVTAEIFRGWLVALGYYS
jgi:hypothetical protein